MHGTIQGTEINSLQHRSSHAAVQWTQLITHTIHSLLVLSVLISTVSSGILTSPHSFPKYPNYNNFINSNNWGENFIN